METGSQKITISDAAARFLASINQTHSSNTGRTYGNAISMLFRLIEEEGMDPQSTPITQLPEDAVVRLGSELKLLSLATEQLYLQAVRTFYEYIAAQGWVDVNLGRLRMLIRKSRRHGRAPALDVDPLQIERVLEFVSQLDHWHPSVDSSTASNDFLRALRDKALLITLADTGLRIDEACSLKRGDLDWTNARAVVGKKKARVRFTVRSIQALEKYLKEPAMLDDASGKASASLPLFARHDKGAGKKIKSITTTTGRNIVDERVKEALGEQEKPKITPHSFRHYFVMKILRASHDLKLAQKLARHASVQTTQRYAYLTEEELDQGFQELFERKDE